MSSSRPDRLDRCLSLLAPVRPGEGRAVAILFLQAFALMLAYYLIRPVREALILTQGGAEFRSYAVAVQALVLLLVIEAELDQRAGELDLWRPLYYALRCASGVLETPVPNDVIIRATRKARDTPSSRLTHRLLRHALRPSVINPATLWARRLLYIRGHWLKMPLPLLAWHLTIKAFRRKEEPA